MRTISKNVLLRMAAQADEADIWGDSSVANHLTNQIQKFADTGVRADEDEYEYTKEQLLEDIKEHMWDIFSRVCDYFEEVPDGKEVEEVLSFEAENLLSNLENLIRGDVGPHDTKTPGEESADSLFEVSDEFMLKLDEPEDEEDSDDSEEDDEESEEDEEDDESEEDDGVDEDDFDEFDDDEEDDEDSDEDSDEDEEK